MTRVSISYLWSISHSRCLLPGAEPNFQRNPYRPSDSRWHPTLLHRCHSTLRSIYSPRRNRKRQSNRQSRCSNLRKCRLCHDATKVDRGTGVDNTIRALDSQGRSRPRLQVSIFFVTPRFHVIRTDRRGTVRAQCFRNSRQLEGGGKGEREGDNCNNR